MYGKLFESLYEGSMVGSGATVFAVWGYVIAHMRADGKPGNHINAQVDINPQLLAFILGESEKEVGRAIAKLCAPDPKSRTPDEQGRRLVKMGQFTYRVVNGAKYMDIRTSEERREYFRIAKRKQRQTAREIVNEAVDADPITKKDKSTMKRKSLEQQMKDAHNDGPQFDHSLVEQPVPALDDSMADPPDGPPPF